MISHPFNKPMLPVPIFMHALILITPSLSLKPAIAVDSLTASSEASKKQKILVLVSSNKTMESRPASPRSGHPESISSTSSALAPPAPIQRVCDSFSSSSSENEDESSRGHEDSGLAEALDREAARMAAANHLARARDELVKHMQATGMLKAVTPVQAEQAEAGEGQQQQQQQQGLGEVWPGGHGHGRGDEDFDELEAQEMERGSGNAGCQGAKHKVHGLGIAVDDRGQAAMVHEGEGKEDDEQHGKQGWEREGQWGHGQTSAGSLGSIGGVGLVVEGEMTGFVEGSEMTGLADRREARRTEKEAAEQKGSKMALEAEMEKHVGK
ncbi:MAG: hypothetical protein LQ346_001441 [Caloplaca aetnensis]|nr:MAG: hypothetical protein LQ346_001441 [Caloplaca aetnensis]